MHLMPSTYHVAIHVTPLEQTALQSRVVCWLLVLLHPQEEYDIRTVEDFVGMSIEHT